MEGYICERKAGKNQAVEHYFLGNHGGHLFQAGKKVDYIFIPGCYFC